MAEKVNRKELAEILGASEQSVRLWHDQGMPGISRGKGVPSEYDVDACRAWLRENGRNLRAPAVDPESQDEGPKGSTRWLEAKIRGELARAELSELELACRRKELCEVAEVRRGLMEASRILRDMVLAVPNRIAPQVVASGDAGAAQRMMREELRAALESFAKLSADQIDKVTG